VAGCVGGRDAAGQRGGVGAGALGTVAGEAERCAWGGRLGAREDKGSSVPREINLRRFGRGEEKRWVWIMFDWSEGRGIDPELDVQRFVSGLGPYMRPLAGRSDDERLVVVAE
jgi:hypothetical protein